MEERERIDRIREGLKVEGMAKLTKTFFKRGRAHTQISAVYKDRDKLSDFRLGLERGMVDLADGSLTKRDREKMHELGLSDFLPPEFVEPVVVEVAPPAPGWSR